MAGGMNMWCTVVECLLQSDARNVMVAVDLENCFNAIDRDALVDELQRHPGLRALARYVVAAYPSGMVSTTHIAGEWRRLCTERGLAQGRPLSPVLASVLLQPCIIEAERAMAEAQGCSLQDFRAMAGIAAYFHRHRRRSVVSVWAIHALLGNVCCLSNSIRLFATTPARRWLLQGGCGHGIQLIW